jgi:hypothetical protein
LIENSALDSAAKTRAKRAVEGLDLSHKRTIDQLNRLDQAMGTQGAKADGKAAGCGFPEVKPPPNRNKLRRTLKAKRRMTRAKKRGVHGQDGKSRRA